MYFKFTFLLLYFYIIIILTDGNEVQCAADIANISIDVRLTAQEISRWVSSESVVVGQRVVVSVSIVVCGRWVVQNLGGGGTDENQSDGNQK